MVCSSSLTCSEDDVGVVADHRVVDAGLVVPLAIAACKLAADMASSTTDLRRLATGKSGSVEGGVTTGTLWMGKGATFGRAPPSVISTMDLRRLKGCSSGMIGGIDDVGVVVAVVGIAVVVGVAVVVGAVAAVGTTEVATLGTATPPDAIARLVVLPDAGVSVLVDVIGVVDVVPSVGVLEVGCCCCCCCASAAAFAAAAAIAVILAERLSMIDIRRRGGIGGKFAGPPSGPTGADGIAGCCCCIRCAF